MDPQIWPSLLELGGTGLLIYVLWRLLEKVLDRQAADHALMIDAMLGVIRENTEAWSKVEKGINGLPEFVRQVDRRLLNGRRKFDEHEGRLTTLETR